MFVDRKEKRMSRMKLVKLFAVAMLPFASVGVASSVSAAPTVAAERSTQQIFSDNDEVQKYVEKYDEGVPLRFNMEKAKADGASQSVLETGEFINEWMIAESDPYSKLDFSILNYGNWCGPGHSGPAAPIDALDRACMAHDKCYSNNGINPSQPWTYISNKTCGCDWALITELTRGLLFGTYQGPSRDYAAKALALFNAKVKLQGC